MTKRRMMSNYETTIFFHFGLNKNNIEVKHKTLYCNRIINPIKLVFILSLFTR